MDGDATTTLCSNQNNNQTTNLPRNVYDCIAVPSFAIVYKLHTPYPTTAGNVLITKVKKLLKEDLEKNYIMAIYRVSQKI